MAQPQQAPRRLDLSERVWFPSYLFPERGWLQFRRLSSADPARATRLTMLALRRRLPRSRAARVRIPAGPCRSGSSVPTSTSFRRRSLLRERDRTGPCRQQSAADIWNPKRSGVFGHPGFETSLPWSSNRAARPRSPLRFAEFRPAYTAGFSADLQEREPRMNAAASGSCRIALVDGRSASVAL